MNGQPQQNDLPLGGTNPGPCTPGTGDPSLCSPSCGGPVNRQCPWTYCTLYTAPDGTRQPTSCKPAIPAGGPLDIGMGGPAGGGESLLGQGGGFSQQGLGAGDVGDHQSLACPDNAGRPFTSQTCGRQTYGGPVVCQPGFYWDRPTCASYRVGTGPQASNPNPAGNTGLPPPNFPAPPADQLPLPEGTVVVEPDSNLSVLVPQDALSAILAPVLQSDDSAIASGVNSQINFAGDAYLSTQASLGQSLVNALVGINDTLTGIESTLDGRIGIALDAAASAVNSAGAKIGKAVDNSIGTTYGYAAQLGVPPPTADDFTAIGAGVPISCGGNPTTTPGAHGAIPTYIAADPGSLPELPDSLQQNNTRAYEPNLGTEACPCGVIEKDTTGNGDWKWYRIPGSICPSGRANSTQGGGGNGPVIVDITPDPGGGGGNDNSIKVHTVIGCEIVDATHVNQILDDGSRVLIQVPDAAAFCRGGYGGDGNNAGGGGLLNNNTGGGGGGNLSVIIGGNPAGPGGNTLINNPSGNNTINVTLCQPTSPQCGGGGSGNLVVTPVPPPDNPTIPGGSGGDGVAASPFGRGTVTYQDAGSHDYNSLSPCRNIVGSTATLSTTLPGVSLSSQLGFDCGSLKAPEIVAKILNQLTPSTSKAVCEFLVGAVDQVQTIISKLVSDAHCRPDQVLPQLTTQFIIGFIDHYTGGTLRPFLTQYSQDVASACPQKVPSVSEANRAYQNGVINADLWRCWVQANGVADVPQSQILWGERTRPAVGEVIRLWLRGDIDDAVADGRLQDLGVKSNDDRGLYFTLTRHVDTVREALSQFIVGAGDDEFNSKYGNTDWFNQAYDENAQKAAKAAGYTREDMRDEFMQLVKYPSVDQLMDGLRRLTDDDEDDDVKITESDVDAIVEKSGINPWWRDRAKRLSYSQFGFRQDGFLYEYGLIDESRLKEIFTQQGWREQDADLLVKAYAKRFSHQRARLKGFMTESEALGLYATDGLTEREATDQLIANGVTEDSARLLLDNEDKKFEARVRSQFVSNVRTQYLAGEIDDGKAISLMVSNGVDAGRASYRIDFWRQEKWTRNKIPSAQQLCGFFTTGVIDIDDYKDGMKNLGYNDDDALSFVKKCSVDYQTRTAKAALAAAEKLKKEAEREAKAAAPCKPPPKPPCPKR